MNDYKIKLKTGIFDSNILYLKGNIKQDKISKKKYLIVKKINSGEYSCFLKVPRTISILGKVLYLRNAKVPGYKDYTKKEIEKISEINKNNPIPLDSLEYYKEI